MFSSCSGPVMVTDDNDDDSDDKVEECGSGIRRLLYNNSESMFC